MQHGSTFVEQQMLQDVEPCVIGSIVQFKDNPAIVNALNLRILFASISLGFRKKMGKTAPTV